MCGQERARGDAGGREQVAGRVHLIPGHPVALAAVGHGELATTVQCGPDEPLDACGVTVRLRDVA